MALSCIAMGILQSISIHFIGKRRTAAPFLGGRPLPGLRGPGFWYAVQDFFAFVTISICTLPLPAKPEFIHGHMFGGLGILAGSVRRWACIPLSIRLHIKGRILLYGTEPAFPDLLQRPGGCPEEKKNSAYGMDYGIL